MSLPDVFKYKDYKSYLIAVAKTLGRGAKADWAQTINCQKSFITQILSSSIHLSLEQAHKLALHFNFEVMEVDYFLLLVQKDRAGHFELVAYFEKKLNQLREDQLILSRRPGGGQSLSEFDQAHFYSSWFYSAVHLTIGIQGLDTFSWSYTVF